MIPQAKCIKCRGHYYGQALRDPRHQMCPKCGEALVIILEPLPASPFFIPIETLGC